MSSTPANRARSARLSLAFVAAVVLVLGLTAIPAGATTGPNVTIAKTAADATINAGDVASFTITVSNTGGAAASNVTITDVLPNGGLAWSESPDVAACSIADAPGGDVLTCTLGTLAAGSSFSVTVQATTSAYECGYDLTNTATVRIGNKSTKSATASISVECEPPPPPPGDGCTFTQGYWKNHEEAWPVSSLMLGSVTYSAEQADDILGQPVQGNGLVSLSHQLIAAKLNVANGADATSIQSTIDAADAMIGGLVVPPVGSGSLSPGSTSALNDALADFNEGTTGPGHCDDEEEEEEDDEGGAA